MARRIIGFDFLEVLLRVPPVFLMDMAMSFSMSSHSATDLVNKATLLGDNAEQQQQHQTFNQQVHQQRRFLEDDDELTWDLTSLTEGLLRTLGVMAALILFVLRTSYLIRTYRWLASVGCVLAAHHINCQLLASAEVADSAEAQDNYQPISLFVEANDFIILILLQSLLAMIYMTQCKLCWDANKFCKFIVFLLFVSMTLVKAGQQVFPYTVDPLAHYFMAFLLISYPMVEVIFRARSLCRLAERAIARVRIIARHHGLPILLETEWTRLLIPHVLRVFWLARLAEHFILQLWSERAIDTDAPTTDSFHPSSMDSFAEASKQMLVKGCDTIVAVLGLTSVVSTIAHHLGCAVQRFLMIQDDDENSFGTVSAILFFMLALQTGLTGLEPDKRFVRLYRNFCLLFTAILHFVHNMVNPVLMSLSASRNRSWNHHGRALSLCAFLVAFPTWFLVYLWRTHQVSTWLLAVSAFSIEVTVRVVISLLVYTLFMWDAYKNTFWERLDDYVYYVRATGNTVEFLFGIFLFFNGAWILLFESGGTIRACMMCIHAYFNIWVQAKSGWKVFIRRRCAVNRINNYTTEATSEQLHRLQDVCAICYQEMSTARITWCGHFFHALCLRKWLYIQDRCPMCHKTLYKMEEDGQDASAGRREDGVAVDQVALVVAGDGGPAVQAGGRGQDRGPVDDDRILRLEAAARPNLGPVEASNALQVVARHQHQD